MEFLAVLFTSIFANNIVIAGKGINDSATFPKKKYSWILLVLFFLESLILAGMAIGFKALVVLLPVFKYLSFFIFVLVMAIITALFYLLVMKVFPETIRNELKDEFVSVTVNTALLAIAMVIMTAKDSVSTLNLFAYALGLPLGYIASTYVFSAILERVNGSTAPKGFKGLPLLILSVAGLCLCLGALSF